MSFALMALGWLRKVPREVWIALAVALAFLWLRSHWIGVGEDRCRAAQEAADARARDKADKAAATAQKAAQDASATIKEETDHAADRARVIVREITAGCPLPAQPDELRDLGDEAVRRAREAL